MCSFAKHPPDAPPRFGLFYEKYKILTCFLAIILTHFLPFLRPQNRGLAFNYPARPPPFGKRPHRVKQSQVPCKLWCSNILKGEKYL